jgi:hypothetical protein
MQRMHPEYQGGWVVFDILPDSIERFIRTDDVLPVVALPNSFSKAFGDGGLEGANHHGDGSGMPDPYIVKNQDAVEMVRHDYVCIKSHPREMLRNLVPAGGDNVPVEEAATITRADCYEICAWGRIIKTGDTN